MAAPMNSRIALFFPNLTAGGVQRSMLLLAEGFLQNGFQVDLVVGQAKGPFLTQVPAGVRLIDLRVRHMRAALPGLVHYLRNSSPAALLSSQTHANILAVAARCLANRKMRLVLCEHNDMASVVRAPGAGSNRLRPLFARVFYPLADGVVAVSVGTADSLSAMTGLPRQSIRVFYNPLIPPDLETRKQAPCSHPWLAAGQPPVLLAVGRLAPQKDFPCLLRAFSIMRKRQEIRLLILGEGPERPSLESLVNELGLQTNVDMPGFVENVFACMARASIFVLSSAWEGFGNVLVEAMACGVPVVATNCPSGPAEILEGGRHGRLVPVGDPIALAEALQATLASAPGIESARERANQFTIERAVQDYLSLLIGNRP